MASEREREREREREEGRVRGSECSLPPFPLMYV